MIDINLQSNNNSPNSLQYLDFTFNSNGDIDTIDSFESSLIIALFGERDRDVILDDNDGSYIHRLDQSKLTTANLNLYRFYAKQALEYLEDEKLITNKEVAVKQVSNKNMSLKITLNSDNKNKVWTHEYRL